MNNNIFIYIIIYNMEYPKATPEIKEEIELPQDKNEKTNESPKDKNETPHHGLRNTVLFTLLLILSATLQWCDKIGGRRQKKDPVKQMEKAQRHQNEYALIIYQLDTKISQFKEETENYKQLVEACKANPDKIELLREAIREKNYIDEINNDIIKLIGKKSEKKKQVNKDQCNSRHELPTSWEYTDNTYWDRVLQTLKKPEQPEEPTIDTNTIHTDTIQ